MLQYYFCVLYFNKERNRDIENEDGGLPDA